jgi:HlyD family secretion protein
MSDRVRRLLLLVPLVVIAVLLPLWCQRDPAPMVRAAPARRGPLRVEVATNGKIEPIDDIEVRARLDGRIVFIPDAGKHAQAGEEIIRFDDAPVAAELVKAESDRLAALEALRAARAEATQVRSRAATDAALFKQGALTREAYEAGQAALRDAEARLAFQEREAPLRVASLELRIKELRAQRESSVVKAPFSGTIYKTQVKKGAMVRIGDPLLWLADLDRLRVRANVDQVDLGRVQPGNQVDVSANAWPGRTWRGMLQEIVPNVVVKESRAVAEALTHFEVPTDGLVPGMTVDVEIIVAAAENALQVPANAVFTVDDSAFVYRVDGSRVRRTPVTTGLSSLNATEISSGLEEGALVVVSPLDGLENGARVRVETTDGKRESGAS